jgi:radical SAM superfamily enzyme YgiQ (UPF0313 family)
MQGDRRVAFLARDLVWEDTSGGSLPFSYAARKIEASLRAAPDLSDVETTVIDLKSDDPEAFFEKIREFRPSLVAASTYIWSAKVFCRVAELVRRFDPAIRFVMGGPAARPSLLGLSPYAPYMRYVDAVAVGEGEELMRRLVRAHSDDDWRKNVPGLMAPHALGWRRTEPLDRVERDTYPSPYQLPPIPQADIGFLETFRGCPISCAFCQWGEERSDRVHSAEYLSWHLRGLVAGGVERVYDVDAGFNLSARAFRNLVAAEREVGALRRMQVLGHIYPAFLLDDHLDFFDSFGRAELTVGVQSFEKDVLRKLGRPFDLSRFERVLDELSGRFPIELEIILGLPGDDPASFRRTFEKAIRVAHKVRVFYCLALPDALLDRASEFDIDFDPETFEVQSCRGWTRESLRAEWEHAREVARAMVRPYLGANWLDFRTERATDGDERSPSDDGLPIPSDALDRLSNAVERSRAGWHLRHAQKKGDRLILDLDGASGRLFLEVAPAAVGRRHFVQHEGLAYSHRGEIAQGGAESLRSFIELVHACVVPVWCSLWAKNRRAEARPTLAR